MVDPVQVNDVVGPEEQLAGRQPVDLDAQRTQVLRELPLVRILAFSRVRGRGEHPERPLQRDGGCEPRLHVWTMKAGGCSQKPLDGPAQTWSPGQSSTMPQLWYKDGMARVRISTTVDEQLLAAARKTRAGVNDSVLVDEALAAFLARNRAAEVDSAYAAYDRLPVDVGDEWGDLASFRAAAGSS